MGEADAAKRGIVRQVYGRAATAAAPAAAGYARRGADAHSGLGCGSPTAFAKLRPGERVLDLGSGAGFDCLAAAVDVGRRGSVVGIDLTPEMVRLASRHAAEAGVVSVAFVQGEIERLPFCAGSFDAVISNCVLNLCADKQRVIAEIWRVLRPGGRLAIADIVATAPLPAALAADASLYAGCLTGASQIDVLAAALDDAGFASFRLRLCSERATLIEAWAPGRGLAGYFAAAEICATK